MRSGTLPKSHGMEEAAEHQMRMWALRLQSQTPPTELPARPTVAQLVHPYIALSREAGVDASEIAKLVAEKLGWKAFDRELLDYMVEHYNFSRVALEYVDERTASWVQEMFGKWLDSKSVSQAEFVSRLGRVILLAAQHESMVFVGRGAQFILPREAGLRVRLIAPRKQRIERIALKRQKGVEDAERFIDETDKGRADFVQRYFHHDLADPRFYDLIINLEHVSRPAAVELIASLSKLAAPAS